MATEWFKKTKAERQGLGAPLTTEPFNSGAFSNILENLAAAKRTEREQVAMVELMLYQMFKPKSKRKKVKAEEVSSLHKQIIRDNWRKAAYRTIAKEGIREIVEARKNAQAARGGSQRPERNTGEANVSAGLWQNWQQHVGLGSMQPQTHMQPMNCMNRHPYTNMHTCMTHPVFMPSTMNAGGANFSQTNLSQGNFSQAFIDQSIHAQKSRPESGPAMHPVPHESEKAPSNQLLQDVCLPCHAYGSHMEASAESHKASTDVGKLTQRDIDALPRFPPAACAMHQKADRSGAAGTSEERTSGPAPGIASGPSLEVVRKSPSAAVEGKAGGTQAQLAAHLASRNSLDRGHSTSKPVAVSAVPPIPVNFSTSESTSSPRARVLDVTAPFRSLSPRRSGALQRSHGQSGSAGHVGAASDHQKSRVSTRRASMDLATTQISTNSADKIKVSTYQHLPDPSHIIIGVPKRTATCPCAAISSTDKTLGSTLLFHSSPAPISASATLNAAAFQEIPSGSTTDSRHHQSVPVLHTITRPTDRLAAVDTTQRGQSEAQKRMLVRQSAARSDTAISSCSMNCTDGSARSRSPSIHASAPFAINTADTGRISPVRLASASHNTPCDKDQPRSPSLSTPTSSACAQGPVKREASVHIHSNPPFPVNSVVQPESTGEEQLQSESQSASVFSHSAYTSIASAGSASTVAAQMKQSAGQAAHRDSMVCHAGSMNGEQVIIGTCSAQSVEATNGKRTVGVVGGGKEGCDSEHDLSGMTWQQWRAQQARKQYAGGNVSHDTGQPGFPSLTMPTSSARAQSPVSRDASVHIHGKSPFPENMFAQSKLVVKESLQSESQFATICSRSVYTSSASAGLASPLQQRSGEVAVRDSKECHAGSMSGEHEKTGACVRSAEDASSIRGTGAVELRSEEAHASGQDVSGMTWQKWRAQQARASAPHTDSKQANTCEIQPADPSSTFRTSTVQGTATMQSARGLRKSQSVRWGEDTVRLFTVPSSSGSMFFKQCDHDGQVPDTGGSGWSGQQPRHYAPAHHSAPLPHSAHSPQGMGPSTGISRTFATSPLVQRGIGEVWNNVPLQISNSPTRVNSVAFSQLTKPCIHAPSCNSTGSFASSMGSYRSLSASSGSHAHSRSSLQMQQQGLQTVQQNRDSSSPISARSSSPHSALGSPQSVDCGSLVSYQTGMANPWARTSCSPARAPALCNTAGSLQDQSTPHPVASGGGRMALDCVYQPTDSRWRTKTCAQTSSASSLGCNSSKSSKALTTQPRQAKSTDRSLSPHSKSAPLGASPVPAVDVTTGKDLYINFTAASNSNSTIAAYPVQLSLGSVGTEQ